MKRKTFSLTRLKLVPGLIYILSTKKIIVDKVGISLVNVDQSHCEIFGTPYKHKKHTATQRVKQIVSKGQEETKTI